MGEEGGREDCTYFVDGLVKRNNIIYTYHIYHGAYRE